MKTIFSILLSIYTIGIYSQNLNEKIVITSKLALRKEPSEKSKIIRTCTFNTKLDVLSIIDTCWINISENNISYWAKVKFGNYIGYVPEYYISDDVVITELATNPNYINYRNWYKIEEKEDGDYLKKITVKIDTLHDKDDNIQYFIIESNKNIKKEKPIKLVGTNRALKERKISNHFSYFRSELTSTATKRKAIWIGYNEPKQINKITFDKDLRFKNYSLNIIDDKLFLSNGKISQNLSEFNDSMTYFVEWYGDMDGDNKLDLLIYVFKHRYLLLSKNSKKLVNLAHHIYIEEDNLNIQ